MSLKLSDMIPELNHTVSYAVHDLYADNAKLESLKATDHLTLMVPTSGSVRIVKLVPES